MPRPAATQRPRKSAYAPGPGTGKRLHWSPDSDAWASSLIHPGRAVDPVRAEQAVGLLLLCRTRTERFIVARCVWQGRPPAEAAAVAGMVTREVSQQLASLRHRLERVARKAKTDAELSRIADVGPGRRPSGHALPPLPLDLTEPSDADDDDEGHST